MPEPKPRRPKCHEVKSWPESYEAVVVSGAKTFDIRQNDRGYHTGDYLLMYEWDPQTEQYTGRHAMCRVDYLAQGRWGLPENLCVMGILVISSDLARYEDGTFVKLIRP